MSKNVQCGGSDATGVHPQFIAIGTYIIPPFLSATIEDGMVCIRPVPLTEFEKGVRDVLVSWSPGEPENSVREKAGRLLELARKELENSEWIRDIKSKEYLDGYAKGQKDAEERYNEETAYHTTPFNPTTWPPCFLGGPCTNPHHDCINCPRQGATDGPCTTGTNINTK